MTAREEMLEAKVKRYELERVKLNEINDKLLTDLLHANQVIREYERMHRAEVINFKTGGQR